MWLVWFTHVSIFRFSKVRLLYPTEKSVHVTCKQLVSPTLSERETTASNHLIFHWACAKYVKPHMSYFAGENMESPQSRLAQRNSYIAECMCKRQNKFTYSFYRFKFNLFVLGTGRWLIQRNLQLLAVVSLSGSIGETNCSQGKKSVTCTPH